MSVMTRDPERGALFLVFISLNKSPTASGRSIAVPLIVRCYCAISHTTDHRARGMFMCSWSLTIGDLSCFNITSRCPCPGCLTFLVFPNTPPYRPINTWILLRRIQPNNGTSWLFPIIDDDMNIKNTRVRHKWVDFDWSGRAGKIQFQWPDMA
jgi:hypothetical protein